MFTSSHVPEGSLHFSVGEGAVGKRTHGSAFNARKEEVLQSLFIDEGKDIFSMCYITSLKSIKNETLKCLVDRVHTILYFSFFVTIYSILIGCKCNFRNVFF